MEDLNSVLIRLRRLEVEVAYLKLINTEENHSARDLLKLLKSPEVKRLHEESYKGRVPLSRLAAITNILPRRLKPQLPQEILRTLKQSRTPANQKLIRTVEFPPGWFQ